LLREKRLSALQRAALAQELRRIETVLSAVDDQVLDLRQPIADAASLGPAGSSL